MTMPLRVACVGAGYFSQFHYDAWQRIAEVELVASMDRDASAALATGLPAFRELHSLLSAVNPDLVDIITPPATHLAFIREALGAKPRAIICQKPFCRGVDEAREAARLSDEMDVPVIVHENFRFQPWYRVIKDQIDTGTLGDVLQITFRLRPGDGQGEQAYLDRQPYFQQMPKFLVRETAVHWVDTFRFLMGEPKAVFADLRRLNPVIAGEDAGYILFSYDGGRRAIFDGNRLLDHAAENTRCTMGEALVEGTRGTLELRGDGSVRLRRFSQIETETIMPPSSYRGFGGDCVYELQKHVVRGLLDGGVLENTATDYLSVLEQKAAIYESARIGSWVDL